MYRNVVYESAKEQMRLFTWDEDGNRIVTTQSYNPYLYIEPKDNRHKTAESIYKTPLRKLVFKRGSDRRQFIRQNGVKRLFENLPEKQQFLLDNFWQVNETPDFTKNDIKMLLLDIETYSPDSFPSIENANHPINVITVYDNLEKKFYTWGTKPYNGKGRPDLEYKYCVSERQLFTEFLNYLEKDYPDILSGWNSEFFDIPYIIKRCERIMGEEEMKRLSPVGNVHYRSIMGQFGRQQIKWFIEGVALLDYLDVYRKFAPLRESYKLDAIGELELNERKVDYGGMDLATLSEKDWDKFIDYNIQDVNILVRLEEKLQYIGLVRMLAYVGCTTFDAAMGALSVINGAFSIRARHRKQIIPTFIRGEDTGKNPGAYVGEPQQGFQNYVLSFDANSLYPNVMITLNLSPETKIGKILEKTDDMIVMELVNGKVKEYDIPSFAKMVKDYNLTISKANIVFHQKEMGLIPEIVDYYYHKRKGFKDEYVDLKKKHAAMKKSDPDYEKTGVELQRAGTKQLTVKILINSIYGYFGNKNAPIGDDDIASSVTLSGQAVIKQSNVIIRDFIKLKTGLSDEDLKKKDPIIYNDTDSSYASIELLIKHLGLTFKNEKGEVHEDIYKLEDELVEYLNKEILIWGKKTFNSKDCRFVFKRECIGEVGIFLQKKRYVLNILDDEGAKVNKTKYTGVEVVRTTLPNSLKPYMKNVIETMLSTQDYQQTNEAMKVVYDKFKELGISEIASVMGIKGYEKYAAQCNGMSVVKGMPIHCKASYYYNQLLKANKLGKKYESIGSGDKVRFFYVKKPNKYNIDSIAFKYEWPEEFDNFFKPDYDKIFEKLIFQPIERFYNAVSWKCYLPNQAVQCDLFSLLGE
jgi:DNA polymerase elongation subunit (family B)